MRVRIRRFASPRGNGGRDRRPNTGAGSAGDRRTGPRGFQDGDIRGYPAPCGEAAYDPLKGGRANDRRLSRLSAVSGRSRSQTLKRVSPDVRSNRRNVGSGWRFLAPVGDLDGDPLKDLVAEPGESAEPDRLDQHVEVARADDDGRSPFVQVAPEGAIGLGGLLPGDEGGALRIAGIAVAGGGVS